MISPTNPKKQSLMPSGKLRRALRGHGHHLSPIVQIGKGGASPAVMKQVEQALADHELVKLRVDADSPEDRFAVADALAELPGVNVVQIVGRSILIYKRHPRNPRYEGRKAAEKAKEKESAAANPSRSSKRRPGSRAPRKPDRRTS